MRERFDSETRLSWVLAALAGLVGAVAFTHSAGYFVTFMTGNTERAALGYFRDQPWLAMTATLLLAAFVAGVVVASLCRRHLWVAHPHGPTVLTALSLGAPPPSFASPHMGGRRLVTSRSYQSRSSRSESAPSIRPLSRTARCQPRLAT